MKYKNIKWLTYSLGQSKTAPYVFNMQKANKQQKEKKNKKKKLKKYARKDFNITTLLANNRGGKPEIESDIDCLTRPTIRVSW